MWRLSVSGHGLRRPVKEKTERNEQALFESKIPELEQMANGIEIEPNKIAYADIQVLEIDNKHTEMQITLYQGMNRQLRKMFEYFGYEVKVLKRIRHATLNLNGLKRGEFKPIKPAQIKELKNFLNRISDEKNSNLR